MKSGRCLGLCLLLIGCATPEQNTRILPFHIAVLPVDLEQKPGDPQIAEEGELAEIKLEFDGAALTDVLVDTMADRFSSVSLLSPTADKSDKAWVTQA